MAELPKYERYELPEVKRVTKGRSSYIEPDIPPPAPGGGISLEQLLWHAAVVAHDTGLRILVGKGSITVGGYQVPNVVSIQIENCSSVFEFFDAWRHLNGVSTGATLMREKIFADQKALQGVPTVQEDIDDEADNPHYYH